MSFQLSPEVDSNKIFLVKRSELEGRLDVIYYSSNIQRFIAADSQQVKIHDIAIKMISGVGAGKQDQAGENDGIIQIRPTNIDTNGELKYDRNVYLPFDSEFEKIKRDDVLFNNTNSQELVEKTSILKEDRELFFSNHITKITVDRTKIIPDYLAILLNIYQRNKIFYSICTNWNNQSGVGLDLLKSLKIPIPPQEIQAQIVTKMDAAYTAKKQKEAEARRLLDSIDNYLLDELGIELPEQEENTIQNRIFTRRLSEVSGGRLDPFFSSLNKRDKSGKYAFYKLKELALIRKGASITSNDIVDGNIPVIAGGQSSPYNHNISNCDSDVITVSASGAYSGYVWYHATPIFASDCTVISSKNTGQLSNQFLFEYLKSEQQDIYNLQQGSGQPHVYPSDLEKIKVPVPPIEKQTEIVDHISNIRNQAKNLQRQAQAQLEQAKKGVEAMYWVRMKDREKELL